jgi:hypothetical protein
MAWIVQVPLSPRHPKPRWQVRYRDDTGRERSAGIYHSPKAAATVRKRIDNGVPPTSKFSPCVNAILDNEQCSL